MSVFVELTTDKLEIAAGVKVIKADEYNCFLEAESLIKSAESKAEAIISEAKAIYETEKQRGYEEGIELGKAQQSEAIISTLSCCNERYRELGPELAGIIQTTVRQILGHFDNSELTVRLAEQALEQNKCNRVIFRVHPDNAPALHNALDRIQEKFSSISYMAIEKDALIEGAGCVLESDLGNIQAQLSTQLDVLNRAVEGNLNHTAGNSSEDGRLVE